MNPLEDFAPVRAMIDCDTGEHTVVWRAGKLELPDHDLEAERALVALGGDPPMCIDLLDAWNEAVSRYPHGWISTAVQPTPTSRPSLLSVRAQVVTQMRATAQTGWTGIAPQATSLPSHVVARMRAQASSSARMVWRSQLLANLPATLRPPLVATCVYKVLRRWETDPGEVARMVEYAFDDVLESKAGWALRESLASWAPPGGLVRLPLHLQFRLLEPADAPSLNVELLGTTALVDVGLPLRWLADVWARGVMLVDGCFVLDVSEARNGGTGLAVRAVRWERSRRAFVPVVAHAIVVNIDDEWTLAWTGAP